MPFRAGGRCGKPPYAIGSQPLFSEDVSEVAFGLAVTCSILGIVGNLLTFAVLTANRSIRRHPSTPFLYSLAASDLIMSVFCLPLLASR